MIKAIAVQTPMNESVAILRGYWAFAVRRKWIILIAILLSLIASWTLCKLLPKTYRSESLILVEDQQVPENYVHGIEQRNIEQRIFLIQRQIMSRTLVVDIIKEFDLYPEEIRKRGLEAVIGRIRQAINVEITDKLVPRAKSMSEGMAVEAFTLSFSHEDPVTAMKVTSRLASQFIEENLKDREQIAQGTSEFLNYELVRAKDDLEKKENEISQFKAKHMNELPHQTEANLRAIDRLQSDLKSVNESRQRLLDRLAMMDNAITEYQITGATNPHFVGGQVSGDPLVRRLRELREKLVTLSAEYYEGYPDTIVTKREIKQLEARLTEQYGPDILAGGEKVFDPYLQDLKRQRNEARSELALVNQRQEELIAEKKDYERRIDKSPAVEQDLLILVRDYENMKSNYQTLHDKRLNARVAENLEKRQKGAQFRIIDPANLPNGPDKPNQRRIMIFGLILGSALGIVLAVMREQWNPRFRLPEDIEHVLGPQLLAVIPDFTLLFGSPSWPKLPQAFNPVTREPCQRNGRSGMHAVPWPRLLPQSGNAMPVEMDIDIIVKGQPGSVVAEQYRVAATRLVLSQGGTNCRVVAVTSAVKGEGKTTTVLNLGYTLARDLGKRVLLLDCDFKRPMLKSYAARLCQVGLADCLRGDVSPDTCLSSFEEVPCWILPAGNCRKIYTELLKADRLGVILTQLREKFDYILMNAPPILPLADMNVLASQADELLLVVRAGSTSQQVVRQALNTLKSSAPLHILLNAVGAPSLPFYMYDYQEDSEAYSDNRANIKVAESE
jgi:succinoglycan biosynthesis transport protein ExoP